LEKTYLGKTEGIINEREEESISAGNTGKKRSVEKAQQEELTHFVKSCIICFFPSNNINIIKTTALSPV
jgi:hypothetical protein